MATTAVLGKAVGEDWRARAELENLTQVVNSRLGLPHSSQVSLRAVCCCLRENLVDLHGGCYSRRDGFDFSAQVFLHPSALPPAISMVGGRMPERLTGCPLLEGLWDRKPRCLAWPGFKLLLKNNTRIQACYARLAASQRGPESRKCASLHLNALQVASKSVCRNLNTSQHVWQTVALEDSGPK